MQPFQERMPLDVSFTAAGRTHRYPLLLPVDASSFMEPVTLDKPKYMRQWMALADPKQQVQESFKVCERPSACPSVCLSLFVGYQRVSLFWCHLRRQATRSTWAMSQW